jgi:hypothetical protein
VGGHDGAHGRGPVIQGADRDDAAHHRAVGGESPDRPNAEADPEGEGDKTDLEVVRPEECGEGAAAHRLVRIPEVGAGRGVSTEERLDRLGEAGGRDVLEPARVDHHQHVRQQPAADQERRRDGRVTEGAAKDLRELGGVKGQRAQGATPRACIHDGVGAADEEVEVVDDARVTALGAGLREVGRGLTVEAAELLDVGRVEGPQPAGVDGRQQCAEALPVRPVLLDERVHLRPPVQPTWTTNRSPSRRRSTSASPTSWRVRVRVCWRRPSII